MYICICKNITDTQIRNVVLKREVSNLSQLSKELGACTQCGKCSHNAKRVINESLAERRVLDQNGVLPF